ncbi:hypothetical protein DBZ36_19855 [Alginatibacterium sediminis]|uniref:Uncharacterized protein n=1 Tax=Alginatibacterium sediminis TaxID=2164068 RepID=A0A420E783_9ALTE|nr:hypothetical protein [Alginatibacterium sediminis]RKF13315.1 hypothetical protein DBZ36_19855 [Alginatibacterium sediminis]
MNNRKASKLFLIISLITVVVACTGPIQNSSSSEPNPEYTQYPYYRVTSDQYSQYYTWLSSLSNQEFEQQIDIVKQQNSSLSQQIKLALLYAHRNSPVRNVHRSQKILASQLDLLSEHPQLGWLEVMNDQMKDAIRWQNRYEELESKFENAEQSSMQLQIEIDKLNGQLKQLTQLEQQLHDNK